MNRNRFPAGWDEARVQRVISDYETQTEEEALADDEAGVEASTTVMNIPRELVPEIRALIAKRQNR
ncbi:MAG: hypothetical protein JOY62_19110 [Acidobacteriaceae bacterium]|nr:hypothetical protein [Acidobacteriaceae bacterium]MBV9782075.1 hypothetical protein [Acidobacteriaceae bacterium]